MIAVQNIQLLVTARRFLAICYRYNAAKEGNCQWETDFSSKKNETGKTKRDTYLNVMK